MEYRFSIERGWENLPELFPLYAQHYREMKARLEADGHQIGAFNPRVQTYVEAWQAGNLINYVVRGEDGKAVGYSNVYLTNDMHNSELIAREDTIFILKEHRNGVGRRLVKFILSDLQARGVKRVGVTAMTDLRVAKIWQRMGFKPVATAMTYYFDGAANVRT
jgi:L-amino acid N-acyltransferase YncA